MCFAPYLLKVPFMAQWLDTPASQLAQLTAEIVTFHFM
jgi:hypothetical protein